MKNTKNAPVEITRGMTVSYNGGWYRVKAAFKNTVNLCGVWGGKTTEKGIAKSEVKEDHEAFYKSWSQSESYMCM